jgi:hypothetical protein
MTRKDQLIQYIDALPSDEILVTWEYQLLNKYKVEDRKSIHTFNCDAYITKELIENNFNSELLGNYTYDADGNPIDGIVVLIDSWDKAKREYLEEGGNE